MRVRVSGLTFDLAVRCATIPAGRARDILQEGRAGAAQPSRRARPRRRHPAEPAEAAVARKQQQCPRAHCQRRIRRLSRNRGTEMSGRTQITECAVSAQDGSRPIRVRRSTQTQRTSSSVGRRSRVRGSRRIRIRRLRGSDVRVNHEPSSVLVRSHTTSICSNSGVCGSVATVVSKP